MLFVDFTVYRAEWHSMKIDTKCNLKTQCVKAGITELSFSIGISPDLITLKKKISTNFSGKQLLLGSQYLSKDKRLHLHIKILFFHFKIYPSKMQLWKYSFCKNILDGLQRLVSSEAKFQNTDSLKRVHLMHKTMQWNVTIDF